MPTLSSLISSPLVAGGEGRGTDWLLRSVDANLGVDGLPQSATGQTALFTGINAAQLMERHVAAFPGPRLKGVLDEHSVLKRVIERGGRSLFANAFPPSFYRAIAERRRRASASVLATWAAGLELPDLEDLAADRALSWDLCRDFANRALGTRLPEITASEAGRHLAGLAAEHSFTLFETFLPDLVGHRRSAVDPRQVTERLDGLLAGVLQARPAELTVVVCSDHGNFEAADHKHHTRNPVPLLVVGPGACEFEEVEDLTGVTPAILRIL